MWVGDKDWPTLNSVSYKVIAVPLINIMIKEAQGMLVAGYL